MLFRSRAALAAARLKLAQLIGPQQRDVVAATRLDLRKAQADLAVLRQRGAPASTIDLALARLKVNVAAARLTLAQSATTRLSVRAPASGTVTSVLSSVGGAADPLTPLLRVEDLAHIVVALNLSEFDVSRTRIGATALVGVDALGGRHAGGRVLDVALSGVDSGGIVNFPVIITVANPRGLRPGMSASARIVIASRRRVVRIPRAAVRTTSAGSTVLMAGTRVLRRVRLGLAGSEFVQVTAGLRVGERIVTPGGA